MKIERVITSWIVLSCAALKVAVAVAVGRHLEDVSKRAIPQLIRIAMASGSVLNLRCPYPANVM